MKASMTSSIIHIIYMILLKLKGFGESQIENVENLVIQKKHLHESNWLKCHQLVLKMLSSNSIICFLNGMLSCLHLY